MAKHKTGLGIMVNRPKPTVGYVDKPKHKMGASRTPTLPKHKGHRNVTR